jgi:hypothetical protein
VQGRLLTRTRIFATGVAVIPVVAGAAVGSAPVSVSASAGSTRAISSGGTATLSGGDVSSSTGGVENPEVSAGGDGALASDRSHTGSASTPVGAVSQPRPVTMSSPGLLASFDGLNHFQNRFGSTAHGNQFSLEPPDQGLCVGTDGSGNTRILETINDVARVYDTSGAPLNAPQALNSFYGYAPAIIRSPLTFGPFVTDPSCLFDAATGHWFMDVLTLDTFPKVGSDGQEHFTGTNHLDLAVSNTSDPLGAWTFYRIPVQDDGTQGTPDHGCSAGHDTSTPLPTNPHACFGDYPHIGSDANGVYLTTNEYSFFGPEFHGAQVYAFSKAQLASTPGTVSVTQFDTHGLDSFGFALNGFTLWPSQTPGGGGDPSAGGTEYFLSSNAAAEAHDTGDGKSTAHPSTQLLVWALTNTSSLGGSSPALTLSNTKLNVGLYAPPPSAEQKSGTQPLRDCLNNNPCIGVLERTTDPFAEKSANLDSNDTRMQQVTWVNGKLWGALDTALSISSAMQAGIEWFTAAPSTSTGAVTSTLAGQGYVGLGNDNLTYPAIGLTSGGTGVMAFTLVGSNFYPSAGYATVTSAGLGAIHIAAAGQGPDDGFSDYKFFGNPPGTTRPRWGDYGSAVAMGSNIWFASEYIGQSCTLSEYERTAFRCGNSRTALANWATRISEVAAP